MKLYLDTKDLIDILQEEVSSTRDHLEQSLRRGGHKLAVSFHSIIEMSVPLVRATAKTNVMALLNRLERMPITFIRSDIYDLELKEALDAYLNTREYRGIHAFVHRFDQTVDLHAQPSTGVFINYSLAETVWDLYSHGALKGLESDADQMRKIVAADRRLYKPPTLKANFAKVIESNLMLFKLSSSGMDISGFANWIYENPNRCPAIRLVYEIWHKIVKNKTDLLEDSDMEDYQHLTCLPYVDCMTLDRRMHGYISQASGNVSLDYRDRIFRSTQDLLCLL
jgi:hypothetical protein